MSTNVFGRVRVTFTAGLWAGKELDVRGEVKITNAIGGEITATANANGTVSRNFEPKPVDIDFTFERKKDGLTLETALGLHDVIIEEIDLGLTHFVSQGFFTGSGEESSKSGDFSGLKISCAHRDYKPR